MAAVLICALGPTSVAGSDGNGNAFLFHCTLVSQEPYPHSGEEVTRRKVGFGEVQNATACWDLDRTAMFRLPLIQDTALLQGYCRNPSVCTEAGLIYLKYAIL